MNANESFTAIKVATAKIETTAGLMKREKNISDKAIEQYRLCMHTLCKMGELAECLIENSNKTQEIILRDNKREE